jgi:hypothetical protein
MRCLTYSSVVPFDPAALYRVVARALSRSLPTIRSRCVSAKRYKTDNLGAAYCLQLANHPGSTKDGVDGSFELMLTVGNLVVN